MYNLSGKLIVLLVVAGVRERPSIIKWATQKFQMQRFIVKNPTTWKV
jgi:hypothetical protein